MNIGHQIDGLHIRLIPLHHMPSTLSQLRQKLYSLHCCIYSKMKRWMLFLYVILRLSPRLILFSLCFLILSFLLLIIHHYCLLEHPSGHSYWVAILQTTFASKFCQFLSVVQLLFCPLCTDRSVPLISHCLNPCKGTATANTAPFPPLPVTPREAGLGFGGAC